MKEEVDWTHFEIITQSQTQQIEKQRKVKRSETEITDHRGMVVHGGSALSSVDETVVQSQTVGWQLPRVTIVRLSSYY